MNADHCRVPFGRIIEIGGRGYKGDEGEIGINNLTVEYDPILLTEKKKFVFGETVTKSITTGINGMNFVPNAKVGDWVAFHWDVACKIIDGRERANLEKYTKSNLF